MGDSRVTEVVVTILKSSSVNAQGDISNHTLGDVLSVSGNNINDGTVATSVVVRENGVLGIGGAVDCGVGNIGLQSHDLLLESFIKVELAGADLVTGDDGAVLTENPVRVHLDMDVDGTFNVEAWYVLAVHGRMIEWVCIDLTREDGLHLHHAVLVCRPHATQESCLVGVQISNANLIVRIVDVQLLEKLQEGGVGRKICETGVRSGSVAVPHVNQDIFQRLTGGHVKDTNIQPQRNTLLVLGHVLAQSLRGRVDIRSLSDLGSQNTGVILNGLEVGGFSVNRPSGVVSMPATFDVTLDASFVELCNVVTALKAHE